METVTYTNTMEYDYDPSHSGAHYMIGNAYKNTGEFMESICKFHRGICETVNSNTAWNEGSDIESLNASIKSSGASLACLYGNSLEQILDVYFANVASSLWIYVTKVDEEVTEYHMNATEFREFVTTWGVLARESGKDLQKVRLKKESMKMLKWLNAKV